MYPMGQMAFAYLAYRLIVRGPMPTAVLVALMGGAFFPTIATEALVRWHLFSLNSLWAHSLVTLALMWVLVAAIRTARVGLLANVALAFAFGYTTHVVIEPLTDLALLYFSVLTDDVGAQWLFPFFEVTIRNPRLDPGFYLLPWQLTVEGFALVFALMNWWKVSPSTTAPIASRAKLAAPVLFVGAGVFAAFAVLAAYPNPHS